MNCCYWAGPMSWIAIVVGSVVILFPEPDVGFANTPQVIWFDVGPLNSCCSDTH